MSIPAGQYTSPTGSASSKLPASIVHLVSDKAKKYLDLVEKFVEEECIPADQLFLAQLARQKPDRWTGHPPILDTLKKRARSLGLWNLFLPIAHFPDISPGFSNVEYGLMAEQLGKSLIAPEVCNCNAPDTGNMEVLAKYGNEEQKRVWLRRLLEGEIRSAFLMTEPEVASSDATNIELSIKSEGDEWVLNGSKWWSTGAGDSRCELYIVMGKTSPQHKDPYKQQSVVLVPSNTPGVKVERMLSTMGYDDAPHGHGHITFTNVRVPKKNIVLGEGRGFEIIQGRLGPGRIHHAMRAVGVAERALEYTLARMTDPRKTPFRTPLSSHGLLISRVAHSRIRITAARLLVLNAAQKIDTSGAKSALREIAEAKIFVPAMCLEVLDWAMQAHGAQGLCQDTPLAAMWANARTLRIVDGPDEVHEMQMGRNELKRGREVAAKIEGQKARAVRLLGGEGLPVGEGWIGEGRLKARL